MLARSRALVVAVGLWGCGEDGLRPAPAPVCEGVFASGSALIPLAPAAFHRLPIGLGIPADTGVLVRSLPEGFRASVTRSLADGQLFLEVRVPGSASGEVRLDLETRCGGTSTPLTLRGLVRPPAWRKGPSWAPGKGGPEARRDPQLFVAPVQPGSSTLALHAFGGFGEAGPLGDLFALQEPLGSWSSLSLEGQPPEPREGARVHLGDDEDAFGLLYGGRAPDEAEEGFTAPPGVHRLELTGASAVFQLASSPEAASPGDFEPAFVVVPGRGLAVSACGWNEVDETHCRARVFDPAAGGFRDLEVVGPVPEGRFGAAYALDGERLVIFGGDRALPGEAPDVADDAWALHFDASPPRWVKLGEAPGLGRRDAAFALDARHRRLLVWGGTRDGKAPLPGLFTLALDRFSEGLVEEIAIEGAAPEPRFGAAAAAWTAPGAEGAPRFAFGFGDTGSELLADLWFLDPPGGLVPVD